MTNARETSPGGGIGARRLLAALLAFQGVSGLAGGVGIVADPTGAALGLPLELLRSSPFVDYMVPGLVLLLALGVLPLVVAYVVWTRRSGAEVGALLVGIGLVVWIGVQIAIIGYQASPPLQAVYGGLGVAIVAAARWTMLEASREGET